MGHRQATRYSAEDDNRAGTVGRAFPPTAAGPAGPGGPGGPAGSVTPAGWRGPVGPARPSARATVAAAAFAVVAVLATRWAWGRWERTDVSGDSMVPALQPGDRLLVWRTTRLKAGDIVAAGDPRHPQRTVLKRVVRYDDAGIFLVGDNERHSTDSRHFGPVPLSLVRGKAVYRYAPPGRAGPLPRPGPGVGPREAASPSGTAPAFPPRPRR